MRRIENRSNLWITIFIYLSIFINSITFFTQPFEFYFGYLIFILLLPVFISRYSFNRNLFYIFLILLIAGIANILLDNDTAPQFFKVYIGLVLSYFFYHYVIQEYHFDVEQLFKWYLKGAFIVALIGVVQFISFQLKFRAGYDYGWLLNKWGVVPGGNFGIRVNSIFGEPTYLAATLSAAFFVSIHNLIRKEYFYLSRFKSLIIISVYILSFSGLAQTGLFLSLLFLALNFGLFRYFIFVIPAAIILFNVFYNNVKDFRERLDGVVALFSGEEFKLGKTHGSSFILYNNYKVATENFKTNFLFGTGIGSHPVAFQKYSLAKKFKVYGFNLNSADANSMLLRLISETGLFGVGIFLFIIFRFYVSRDAIEDSYHWLISNAILVMILLNLLRQGHYFLNGFPFFVLLYIYNYLSYTKQLPNQEELDLENSEKHTLSVST
jgi:hypothetical protein